MNKYKELLLDYLAEKNKIVYKYSGMELATKADLTEVRRDWTNEKCRNALMYLEVLHTDSSTCPWCIVVSYCSHCGYGENNGECTDFSSRYHRILCSLEELQDRTMYINELPGMLELVASTKNKYNQLAKEG